MENTPKISIIIATYNAGSFIERALQSVLDQKYPNTELIVIDGNSKDDTVSKIRKFEDGIAYWVSEPDKGIYDAWNKGVDKATGDWTMFLGADDLLVPGAIKDYVEFLKGVGKEVDYVSSRIEMIDENDTTIRIKGWPWEWPMFLKEMTVAHPGSLHSKRLFEKYGRFDTSYKITGDYEFLLRPGKELKTAYYDKVQVKMSEGGASDSIAAVKEHLRAASKTGGYPEYKAKLNGAVVYIKFKGKYLLRRFGFNAYLKT
ncbi:glycosyltransferase [Pedobacter sp. HMF7647]|uniref:Glycosyltransferase n=1 Tax=Hufsiella arboris TaxID=2695275 RepID=A0A7K1YC13_9SPHI|nr:glycosyltransferase family 2 protein [Hufsiella arboris]MXV52123.1 glycosyltransferase [Hufsiella arboris]